MTQYLRQFIKKTILCIVFTIAWTGMAQTQESAANAMRSGFTFISG